MATHAFSGISTMRSSRYYIDPTIKNGPVKVIKPADPEKLENFRKRFPVRNNRGTKTIDYLNDPNRLRVSIQTQTIEI